MDRNLESMDGNRDWETLDLFTDHTYMGLSQDDFKEASITSFYGFIALFALGILVTIFAVLERIGVFSWRVFLIMHSVSAASIILISVLIIYVVIRFLGAHLIFNHNRVLVPQEIGPLLYPAAYILLSKP